MPITPLPQFEADLEEDRKLYESLKPPKTLVVRFGARYLVGEFPYKGDVTPGCGSKIVVRTHRGTEIGEMLTSTCANSGCSKSVSRKEMLDYIDRSGGRQYPFFTRGEALRVASAEDMNRQAALEQQRHGLKMDARKRAERLELDIKIIDAEPLLGGERMTFYYMSEHRVDFRQLVEELATEHKTRIEMEQVGARDEARLTADYERCGQYCCCKNFLKVLKPVSMKSAKIQKATLDPLKISGRCGRLMCCLRYEDETYDELRKKLPRRKTHVGTPEGNGIVLDTQILTQLVLVLLDDSDQRVAIPIEELTEPREGPPPAKPAERTESRRPKREDRGRRPAREEPRESKPDEGQDQETGDRPAKKRRRRRRRRSGSGEGGPNTPQGDRRPEGDRPPQGDRPAQKERPAQGPGGSESGGQGADGPKSESSGEPGSDRPKRKRRRRRRRGKGPGGSGQGPQGDGGGSPPQNPGGDSGT